MPTHGSRSPRRSKRSWNENEWSAGGGRRREPIIFTQKTRPESVQIGDRLAGGHIRFSNLDAKTRVNYLSPHPYAQNGRARARASRRLPLKSLRGSQHSRLIN